MKELIRSERGSALTVMLLILIPLLLVGILLVTETPRAVRNSDPDLGRAVQEAVKAATFAVDEGSQANHDFRISPDLAHDIFRKTLAKNLALSDITLEPQSGSAMSGAPEYILVVYNGTNPYVPAGAEYQDGGFINWINGDLPRTFSIGDFFLTPDGSGNREFEVTSPSCLAVVRCQGKTVLGDSRAITRYAVAKIKVR